jgi:hypothetical protein
VDNRSEVREFLTTRLTPEQVGLPTTGGRRVPGLRRSEVATVAGLSVEYYARLERGQIAGASSASSTRSPARCSSTRPNEPTFSILREPLTASPPRVVPVVERRARPRHD